MPKWLEKAANGVYTSSLPLNDLLTESLYYPGSGLNGTPVKFLAGNVYSFIYADYAVKKDNFLENAYGSGRDSGFMGYKPVYRRELTKQDIVPEGWTPFLNPSDIKGIHRRVNLKWLARMQEKCELFADWSIWERAEGYDESHGPRLFSFLFIAGEMGAVYQGLYCRCNIRPLMIAIIQLGGFDLGWENPLKNDSFFKVCLKLNHAGMPSYLIRGGYTTLGASRYRKPCYFEYEDSYVAKIPERGAHIFRLKNGL